MSAVAELEYSTNNCKQLCAGNVLNISSTGVALTFTVLWLLSETKKKLPRETLETENIPSTHKKRY